MYIWKLFGYQRKCGRKSIRKIKSHKYARIRMISVLCLKILKINKKKGFEYEKEDQKKGIYLKISIMGTI